MKGTGLVCCKLGQVRKKAAVAVRVRSVSLLLEVDEYGRRKRKSVCGIGP